MGDVPASAIDVLIKKGTRCALCLLYPLFATSSVNSTKDYADAQKNTVNLRAGKSMVTGFHLQRRLIDRFEIRAAKRLEVADQLIVPALTRVELGLAIFQQGYLLF
jgi:hypothetical protein